MDHMKMMLKGKAYHTSGKMNRVVDFLRDTVGTPKEGVDFLLYTAGFIMGANKVDPTSDSVASHLALGAAMAMAAKMLVEKEEGEKEVGPISEHTRDTLSRIFRMGEPPAGSKPN